MATAKAQPATTTPKLPAAIFEADTSNHQLVALAYNAYLANGRANNARTMTRGEISGGGKKPWKQKGTGRARVGSSRNPIWRGGGIVFGPNGSENYKLKLSKVMRRTAVKQALTLAAKAGKIIIASEFMIADGKTKTAASQLTKLGSNRRTLIITDSKDPMTMRACANLPEVKLVQATYVNVYDLLNADAVVITKTGLSALESHLSTAEAA